MTQPPFHLAFGVHDLEAARAFYVDVLGCGTGRSDARWIDFDFHGHQLVAHLVDGGARARDTNPVDGDDVPVPHFGLVLPWTEWEALAERLTSAGVHFLLKPHVRFEGTAGEQATLFVADPSGNALELKAMRRPEALFES